MSDNNGIGIQEFSQLLQIVNNLLERVNDQEKYIKNLYQNNINVMLGWENGINYPKLDYRMEIERNYRGVTEKKRTPQLVVSLTSFPDRMYDIKYALYSILHQSLKPDRVVLWLAREQFPDGEAGIGQDILRLKDNGLEIMWCEDIRSYKKLIPALEAFPDDIIVTTDDDVFYPEDWLERLYESYLKEPESIHAHRVRRIELSADGELEPYETWGVIDYKTDSTFLAIATGCGGILYPPHSLYKDILDKTKFTRISKNADDLWFWAMEALNGTKVKVVENGYRELAPINMARNLGLCEEQPLSLSNCKSAGEDTNNTYLKNILSEYPQIKELFKRELSNTGEGASHNGWTSGEYWQSRYLAGGTSGAGSYNRLADFKAKIINGLVEEYGITSVVEWGCGDGNQLSLAKYPEYTGFDVSQEAVNICRQKFSKDETKQFVCCKDSSFTTDIKADMALSLDVIYHLLEDDVYELYMSRLFSSSKKYVCIYSCDFEKYHAGHVRCRTFTGYVKEKFPEWELIKTIPNEWPYDENDPDNTSWSDFYIYQKR